MIMRISLLSLGFVSVLGMALAQAPNGRQQYEARCSRCHGGDVVSSGMVPDLRYANKGMHEIFPQVVRGGVLREFGMPSFSEDLTSEQVRSIQGYILNRALQSAQAEAAANH